MTQHEISAIRSALLEWFATAKRVMPWRGAKDPYAILVSEVMLQQTQVATVVPYFERFMEAFPSVQALAAADEDAVLAVWSGLGYYGRARRLREAARMIVGRHSGQVPAELDALLALPGVGAYTAGAVGSIAFGLVFPTVDGNTVRVLARLLAQRGNVWSGAARRRIEAVAAALVCPERPGEWNQALMELGSTLCAAAPKCAACPLKQHCRAHARGLVGRIPLAKPRAATERRIVAAAIVVRRGRVLLARRPAGGIWPGLWELPNAEVHSDGLTDVLVHLLAEGFELRASDLRELGRIRYGVTNLRMEMAVLTSSNVRGRTAAHGHAETGWFTRAHALSLPMPAPHRRALGMWRQAGTWERGNLQQ